MANQLGSLTVAPRCHRKHQRHAKFARVKTGANQLSAFLAGQATRLSSTSTLVFGKLVKNTADRIRTASTFGSLS